MSGYRSLHREQVLPTAIWSCQATPLLRQKRRPQDAENNKDRWRIWTGSADGIVRSHVASRPSTTTAAAGSNNNNEDLTTTTTLNASALQLHCTHTLTGGPNESRTAAAAADGTTSPTSMRTGSLGCSVIHTIRNYTGEDTEAGDLVVASLELAGRIRIWDFPASWDDDDESTTRNKNDPTTTTTACAACLSEFTIANATGTTLQLASPRGFRTAVVIVAAVGCLDGTIAIVSTGILVANHNQNNNAMAATKPSQPSTAGTVLE